MKRAIIVAAFVFMLLTTAFAATILELPNWWEHVYADGILGDVKIHPLSIWLAMLAVWAIWAAVFFVYWRSGDRYTQWTRIIRALVAGSFLELFVATGVYVWNPHKEECYCARGSYTGLVFGGTVLLWAFGPGIILLFLRERYRRQKLNPHCHQCGYDLRGTIAAGRTQCPECGAAVGAR